MCQAISNKKVIAYELIKCSFNKKKFNEFIKNKVMPNITDVPVLMDGVSIHKSKKLSDIFAEHDIRLSVTQSNDLSKTQGGTKIINVPYSPQFTFNGITFNNNHYNVWGGGGVSPYPN